MAKKWKDETSFTDRGIVLGDQFNCINEVDQIWTAAGLEKAGFTYERDGLRLTITGVPEDEYLVQATTDSAKCYCETAEEANRMFNRARTDGRYINVEILKGYPGHWTLIKRYDPRG